MNIEPRTDCKEFEPKLHENHCGDCQTDGHYLCAGCRYIAPFDQMELSDNRERYYPQQERESREMIDAMQARIAELEKEDAEIDMCRQKGVSLEKNEEISNRQRDIENELSQLKKEFKK